MANNGLRYEGKTLPFGNGLQQGTDVRSRPDAFLDIATDVSFDDLGGLQTRLPYGAAQGSIFGGGTISDARRIVANGDELVLMTKDKLYSWNAKLSAWVLRATHLAVSVDETPRFATTGDQITGDRAELLGTVVFAWVEGAQVYAAALDKTTGSVLVSPTAVSTAIGRPRLVALATKILLFVEASTTLLTVRAIDPAAPGTAIAGAGTTVLATNYNLFYDVVRAGTQDLVVGACRRQTTTSYTVFTVTPALVVTAVTKARTADGPLAVATIADGTKTQIVRGNSTNVEGDLLTTSTLADLFTAQAIGTIVGTPTNQITAEFVTTTCRVFWSYRENSDATVDYRTKSNTVTTANVVGTEADFLLEVGIASRAFAYDGHVYVWLVFAAASAAFFGVSGGRALGLRAQLQNAYYLYRDDGLLVSRAAFDVAGGFSAATGHLPGVALTSGSTGFAWAGGVRRIIELGGEASTGFDSRSVTEIAFTFDDDAARRCGRLGATLYIAGGLPLQYDGTNLVELGFQVYPFLLAGSAGSGGSLGAGAYDYQSTLRWTNAQGESERSTTAIGVEVTAAANDKIALLVLPLHVTRRTNAAGAPAIEWWRTEVNPPDGAPSYLVTGKDPTTITGANCYIPNDSTIYQTASFEDNFTDAILVGKQQNPENGDVLENLAPPGASIIKATDTRLYLWGIPGDPDRFWYSKQRDTGQIAAFHDTLTARVPAPGGRGTSLWFQGQVLYVARETAIYAFTGVGKDNLGQGQGYSDAQEVSLDVGVVNDESVAWTPLGTIFKSRKGWYLCTGNGVRYIGAPVKDFDSETVVAVHVLETKHEVRILTGSRMLVWDYHAATQESPLGQWGQRSITGGVHATMYDATHVYLTAGGSHTEATTFSGVTYGMDAETAWLKPIDLQGAIRVRKAQPLGEVRSACFVRIRAAYNYEMDGTTPRYVDDKVYDARALVAGNPLQFALGLKRPSCTAVKVRITAVAEGTSATLSTLSGSVDGTLSADVFALTISGSHLWDATFKAFTTDDAALIGAVPMIGEIGNTVTMSVGFVDDPTLDGGTAIVDVRDHFLFTPATGAWTPLVNNVGVRVAAFAGGVGDLGVIGVGELATSIQSGTKLMQVQLTDPEEAVIDMATMDGVLVTGTFANGAFSVPTGEGIKLTGLGLEVGYEPGLFRRLKSAQKL